MQFSVIRLIFFLNYSSKNLLLFFKLEISNLAEKRWIKLFNIVIFRASFRFHSEINVLIINSVLRFNGNPANQRFHTKDDTRDRRWKHTREGKRERGDKLKRRDFRFFATGSTG